MGAPGASLLGIWETTDLGRPVLAGASGLEETVSNRPSTPFPTSRAGIRSADLPVHVRFFFLPLMTPGLTHPLWSFELVAYINKFDLSQSKDSTFIFFVSELMIRCADGADPFMGRSAKQKSGEAALVFGAATRSATF